MSLTEEQVERIREIARRDAQADIETVNASGLELTEENAASITDPTLRGAFKRQLEARSWRESHQHE
jgi:hypothetical protein